MPQYTDADHNYTIEYPSMWVALTDEGSPHISLASLVTGGSLRIEAYRSSSPAGNLRPEATLRALVEADCQRRPPGLQPAILPSQLGGLHSATTCYDLPETRGSACGHARSWVFNCGHAQVRCCYRCRQSDAGLDDEDLDEMLATLTIHDSARLDAGSFGRYYFSLLRRHRSQIAGQPPDGLTLTLRDGQHVLLEQLYNHYLQQPDRLDALIESHLDLLDFCGDDVPDLANYQAVRSLVFPKLCRATSGVLPAHRLRFWPGLAIGAVVRGTVFHYGVNTERLHQWGFAALTDIWKDLTASLYRLPAVRPRGQCDGRGQVQAIRYADHPFSASFLLYEDFYATVSRNLDASEFLVGLPEPGTVSCFREDDPRFIAEHTTQLRWEYHRSIERLTDTIYLVTGPTRAHIKPYDVLHCCARRG